MQKERRGLFIVLEGPDGAGITTQAALLRDGLVARNMKAFATKEPTNGPDGKATFGIPVVIEVDGRVIAGSTGFAPR